MYNVIFVLLGLALVVVGQPDKKCGRLEHSMKCCNTHMDKKPETNEDDFKECFKLDRKPPSCEVEMCIAKKINVVSSDGTIDKKALAEIIEKQLDSDPDLADIIKDKCVNGDLSNYGQEDFCEITKLKLCVGVQFVKSCNDWNDEDDCKGMEDLANECTKDFD